MSPVKSFGKRSFDRSHVVIGIFSARCLFSECQLSKQLREQKSPAKQEQKEPTVLGEIKISHAHAIIYYLIPHRLLNVFAISAEEPLTTNCGSVCLFVCLFGWCHGDTDTYRWIKDNSTIGGAGWSPEREICSWAAAVWLLLSFLLFLIDFGGCKSLLLLLFINTSDRKHFHLTVIMNLVNPKCFIKGFSSFLSCLLHPGLNKWTYCAKYGWNGPLLIQMGLFVTVVVLCTKASLKTGFYYCLYFHLKCI